MPRRPDLARRTELARAAFEVLRERGMQTAMRELADALGIKRPTLYFYFRDLGAVFETLLDQAMHALTETALARARAHDHPIDRLCAVIDGALAFHRDQPQLFAGFLQLWALSGRGPSSALDRTRYGMRAARDGLVAELRAGIARKDVRPCDPERIVDLVLAVVEGTAMHHTLGLAPIDDAAGELIRRVLEPLRAPARRRRTRP
jgi:TetR/AcrR family transcriptional regulator